MDFTLVSTVFNEAKRLNQTINDLKAQTVQPSEIIITDAGSTDDTLKMLLAWKSTSSIPITILQKQGCNVAQGRNMAIHNAVFDLIVSTDFGCRFHPLWLESITAPFRTRDINVVSGAYTVKEEEQITLAAKAAYILSNGYCTDVSAPWFIPSSRSIAYKKEVFEKIGGYCEWLTLAADDLVFGKEIMAHGYKFYPVNESYVYWIRHSKAIGFIKEAGRYGLGDGEANVNFKNFIVNSIETTFRMLMFLNLVTIILLAFLHKLRYEYFIITAILAVGFRPYLSYFKCWLKFRSNKYDFKTLCYGFYLLEKTRHKYITSYLKGYFFSTPEQKREALHLKKRLNTQ